MQTINSKDFIDYLTGAVSVPVALKDHISNNPFEIEFKDLKVLGTIKLANMTIQKRVTIRSGEYSLEIGNIEIQEIFWIWGGDFSSLKILGTKVSGKGSFSIQGGNFLGVLEIQGVDFANNFTISGGTFKHGMRIKQSVFKKAFQLSGGDFGAWVEFNDATIGSNLIIHSSAFFFGVQIRTSKVQDLTVWECPGLRFLAFRVSTLGSLSIKAEHSLRVFGFNSQLIALNLRDTVLTKDVSVFFTDVKINHLRFDRFYNFGYLCFNNLLEMTNDPFNNTLLPMSRLSVVNCNLGKIDFNGCDLTKFQLEFQNSKILEINVFGGLFNNNIQTPDATGVVEHNEQLRLFNGQMKKVFENKGNIVASSNAHTEDMNAYYRTLAWSWLSPWKGGNWEIMNLWLNKVSTNHGKSWHRGLGSLILVGLLLFWGYVASLGYYFGGFDGAAFDEFGKLMSYYLEFLNPIHKADYIADDLKIKVTGWSRFWEGVSRVVIAYFVYQLIQAFRKHGKRST
jgi:hypothetical protein